MFWTVNGLVYCLTWTLNSCGVSQISSLEHQAVGSFTMVLTPCSTRFKAIFVAVSTLLVFVELNSEQVVRSHLFQNEPVGQADQGL